MKCKKIGTLPCLPHLPKLACSIHATWSSNLIQSLHVVPGSVDLGPGRLRDGRRASDPAGRRRPDALLGHGRRPRRRRRREAHPGSDLVKNVSEMGSNDYRRWAIRWAPRLSSVPWPISVLL